MRDINWAMKRVMLHLKPIESKTNICFPNEGVRRITGIAIRIITSTVIRLRRMNFTELRATNIDR